MPHVQHHGAADARSTHHESAGEVGRAHAIARNALPAQPRIFLTVAYRACRPRMAAFTCMKILDLRFDQRNTRLKAVPAVGERALTK
jgi:hypothetical protein